MTMGFPCGSVAKNLPANAGNVGLIPGLGRPPGEGNGSTLQYSCQGNPMDRGGLPVRWGPAALLPAHTPTVLRFPGFSRPPRPALLPRHHPATLTPAVRKPRRTPGPAAPVETWPLEGRSAEQRRNLAPPETACTQCLRSARQKVPFC